MSSSSVSSAIAKSLFHLLLKPRLVLAKKGLSWKSTPPYGFDPTTLAIQDLRVAHQIVGWAARLAWGFCARIGSSPPATCRSQVGLAIHIEDFWYKFFLHIFDFGSMPCVDCGRIPVGEFKQFLRWLHNLQLLRGRDHQIVRTTPRHPGDGELIEKCDGIAEPFVRAPLLTPQFQGFPLTSLD
jgi:hypothetical protein